MIPKCPDCKSNKEVEYSGETQMSNSGELYEVKIYNCGKCGGEFDEDEIDDRIYPHPHTSFPLEKE